MAGKTKGTGWDRAVALQGLVCRGYAAGAGCPAAWRLLFGVALLEAVDAAAGVVDLVLAGVERMRLARHFILDQRVFVAVFPLDGFVALNGRTRLEDQVAGHVLKDNFAVFGMDIGFHARDSCTDITESSRLL